MKPVKVYYNRKKGYWYLAGGAGALLGAFLLAAFIEEIFLFGISIFLVGMGIKTLLMTKPQLIFTKEGFKAYDSAKVVPWYAVEKIALKDFKVDQGELETHLVLYTRIKAPTSNNLLVKKYPVERLQLNPSIIRDLALKFKNYGNNDSGVDRFGVKQE